MAGAAVRPPTDSLVQYQASSPILPCSFIQQGEFCPWNIAQMFRGGLEVKVWEDCLLKHLESQLTYTLSSCLVHVAIKLFLLQFTLGWPQVGFILVAMFTTPHLTNDSGRSFWSLPHSPPGRAQRCCSHLRPGPPLAAQAPPLWAYQERLILWAMSH